MVGAGIAYAVHRKRKSAGELPPKGTDVIPPATSKKTGGGGAPTAPSFPYSLDEAKALETSWAIAYVAENCDPTVGKLAKSVDALTDDVFYEMYKIKKIPDGYGSSWQPYVDSWLRARTLIRQQADAAGC